jgi:hypothetical protein
MGLPGQSRVRVGASCVGVFLLAIVAISGPVAAAPKPISGKLSKPGYTVIALGTGGQKAVRASRGKFRVKPPSARVTLHLRAPNGTYAGPVVVGRGKKGRRAIVGVKAGARLGHVSVRRGYAKPSRRLRTRWVDASSVARARRGIPIGARVFGRVRSRPPRNPIPGDWDFDGVPDSLDIDDDGDLILDDVDRSRAPRAAQEVFDSPLLHHFLELSLSNTVNVNAGSTDEQIEGTPFFGAVEIRSAALLIGHPPMAASTELDCGRDNPATPELEGLSYCRPGGNGTIFPDGIGRPGQDFPECCDSDGDGFGTLTESGHNSAVGMDLHYTATTAELKTGQVLIKRINNASGVEIGSFSHTLQYVFATVPALVSYSDTQGNTGTVSYPVAPSAPPPGPPGGPGTRGNGFPVSAGPDGVVVTLTLWQPQRRPIGEGTNREACLDETPPCAWIDIGGLTYSAVVHSNPPSGMFVRKECPQAAYSVPPEQPFSLPTPPAGTGLTHTLADRPASPNNKLTYTLNLTQCLAGLPWNPGEEVDVHFRASGRPRFAGSEPGHATQFYVAFKLE